MEKSRIGLVARLDPFEVEKRQVMASVDASPGLVAATVEELRRNRIKTGFVVAGFEDPQFELERILVREVGSCPLVVKTGNARHTIWPLRKSRDLEEIVDGLRAKECFLFEGVHLFRAARRIRDIAQEEKWGLPEEEFYPLAYLVNVYDFGVALEARHYLLPEREDFDINRYVLEADRFFEIRTYRWDKKEDREHARAEFEEDLRIHATNRVVVGAAFRGEKQFFLFILKENLDRSALLPPDVSSLFHNFSVVYLRRLFVEKYYWKEENPEENWRRTVAAPGVTRALRRIEKEKFGAAFFHHPPTKRSLANLARRGKRLPAGCIRLTPPALPELVMDRLSPCMTRARGK